MRSNLTLICLLSLLTSATAMAQTSYTWTGAQGSNWSSPSNWSPSGVPSAADTVVIETGEPVLETDVTVAAVRFSGGSLSGDGNLTVTDTFTWSGGTLNGRNYAETAALTIPTGATLYIEGEANKGLRGRDIFNNGTIVWDGTGNLVVSWSTIIENRAGATFDIRSDAAWTRSNGTMELKNEGLIVKSAGTGTSTIGYPYGELINEGTIRIESGTLHLANETVRTSGEGAIEIGRDASLRFAQGEYQFGPGSTVTGEGTLRVTNGIARFGTASLTGPTVITGGRLLFASQTTPAELADVALSGAQFSGGRLGGEGSINVNGLLTWSGGYLGTAGKGVINLLGGVSAEGDATKYFGEGTFNNSAAFTWTGAGNLVVVSSSVFNNLEGAVFDIRNDARIARSNGYIDYVNAGLLVKSSGEGTTNLDLVFAHFNNTGIVRAEAGTLLINNDDPSTDTGSYVIEDGTALRFSGHRRTFTETASIEGVGTLIIDENMDFQMGGAIRPGLPIGTLTVGGNFPPPQDAGVLEIEIGGTAPVEAHDLFTATNIANLGGVLRLVLTDGFEPSDDETFTIVTSLAVQGTFKDVEPPEGYLAEIFYESQDVSVRLVPVGECTEGLQADEHTVALYKFDEPLPGTSFDASGNGHDLSDEGTSVAEGRFCKARRFDGETDRIDMDAVRTAMQGLTAFTIEYVARSEDGSHVPAIVNHGCGNGWLVRPESESIRFGIKTTAAGGDCFWNVDTASEASQLDTLWHYYALTWNGDSLHIYRDGAVVGSRKAGGVFLHNQSNSFRAWLGYTDYNPRYYSGLADDLRFSDIARSGEEILQTAVGLGFDGPAVSAADGPATPDEFALHAPFPNPSSGQITLEFDLPQSKSMTLAVYDVLGRRITVLVDDAMSSGRHRIRFDSANLPSGTYFVRMTTDGGFAATRTITLLR